MLTSRKKIAVMTVFVLALALMAWKNQYRIATSIRISGTYTHPVFVNYSWDSGSGTNGDEESSSWLGDFRDFENKTHSLEIGFSKPAHESPSLARVWVCGIILDELLGRPGKVGYKPVNAIKGKSELTYKKPLKMEARFGSFILNLENGAAVADLYIKVDEQIFNITLSRPWTVSVIRMQRFLPGPAVNHLEMPQLKLRMVKIEFYKDEPAGAISTLEFLAKATAVRLPLPKFEAGRGVLTISPELLRNSKFHPLLFAVQVLLALLLAWLCHEGLSFLGRLPDRRIATLIKRVFLADQRWVFWGIFIVSFMVFSLWLLGQWPGEMNWDTFVMWRQTQTLQITNNHSFVYVLLLCLFKQFLDSPASMALFQVACMSFLLAWIFHFAYQQGAHRRWLTLCLLLLLGSVPIGLSTVFVNTTTLFALIAAFWGFYLFRVAFLRKWGKPLAFSGKELFALAALFYLLVSLRHHALSYVLILPILVWVMNIFTPREFKKFMVFFLLLFFAVHGVVATLLGVHQRTKYSTLVNLYRKPLVLPPKMTGNRIEAQADTGVTSPDRSRTPVRTQVLHPRQGPEIEEESTGLSIRRILDNFPQYLGARLQLFLETIGWGKNTTLYFHRGREIAMIKMQRSPSLRPLIGRPVLSALAWQQETWLRATTDFRGILKPRWLFWNTGISLVFLLIILACYGRFPLSAYSSFFILSQVILLFFWIPSVRWRYLYFVYLFGLVVLPLILAEYRHTSVDRPNRTGWNRKRS